MTFDEAIDGALKQRKYDLLMDRALDIRRMIGRIIEKVLDWLLAHLDLKPLGGARYNTDLIVNIFIVAAIVIVLAVGAAIFIAAGRRKRRMKAEMDSMDAIFDELKNKNVTFDGLMLQSRGFAEEGRYREAVRYKYIGLLWLLNNKNVIFLDQAKTNSQLKREINRSAPRFSNAFSQAVDVFNRVWFGHKPMTGGDYREFDARMDGFMMEARGEGGAVG